MSELTEQGIAALNQDRREEARLLFLEAITRNPRDAAAWLELAKASDDDEQRADCLRCVLEIEPGNLAAHITLDQIETQQNLSAVECAVCGRTGRITCPRCNGECTELCSVCQGQTFQPCLVCHGSGWRAVEAPLVLSTSLNTQAPESWRECDQCRGTGLVDCQACQAHGRDWCLACEGSGQVVCLDCAEARLKPELGERLAEAVMSALKSDGARAQTLLAGLQKAVPFANLLWQVGLADRPYRLAPQLRAWVEAHPLDRAARTLLTVLPQTPQEPFPPRDKPVQLFKKLPPLSPAPVVAAPRLVMPKHSGNLLRDAILASRIGNRDQALVLLLQAVMQEPHNEEAWLWLARLMETEAQVIECLRHIVEINPDNKLAQEELQRLTGDQGNVQISKVQQTFEV